MEDANKPPFLGSWKNIYIAVLIFQIILVIFFIYLTNIYA